MAELSPILVQVKLEVDKFKSDLDTTTGKLKGFGDTADAQGGKMSGLAGHLKGLVSGFVALAAVKQAADFLNEAGKAAAEDAKSAGLLEQQLKNTTGANKEQVAAVESSIKAMSLQYGVADDKLRPAFASLVRATKDVGEATKLTDLAQNISAGTGKSLESVSLALGKAHNGQLGALQRLVPGIKDAKDPMAELTKQFAGAAEKAADTDPYQRMTVAFGEIKESLGRAVLPIVSKFADLLTTAEPYISRFVDALLKLGSGDTSGITSIFTSISNGISEFISGGGLEKFIQGFFAMRQKIIDVMIELLPKLITALVEMIPKLVESLVGMIPTLIAGAIQLFNGLVQGLVTVIPIVIKAMLDAWPTVIKALVDALPLLIDGAIELFLGLIDALVEVIPQLIDALVDLIPKLVDTLIRLIPKLIDGAIKLFLGIIEGLAKALPKIIEAVIKIVPKLVEALIETIPKLIDAGFQLIKGLIKGLWDNAPKLIGALAKDLGDLLVNSVKAIFGIKSPSTVFAGIGKNIALGLDVGIRSGIGNVTDAMGALTGATGIGGTIGVGVTGSFSGRGSAGTIRNSTNNQSINVNVQAQSGANPTDIARAAVNAIRFGVPSYRGV